MIASTAEELERRSLSVLDADFPLVDASRNGERAAFEQLVRRYDQKLYRTAKSMIHNHEDAEEVVQTTFLKAYLNLCRFRGNAKFSTWLIRIAMNESFIKLRKQISRKEQPLDSHTGFEADGGNQNVPDLTDWARNPESVYGAIELREILENSLNKLQPRLRAVFLLQEIEGYSISETSGILKLTGTAVKTRLSRARLQLREELTRYFKNRH